METPEIITPNLNLRPFTLDDVDPLFQILEVPGVLRYFPNPDPPERERVQKLIKRQIQHWKIMVTVGGQSIHELTAS